MIKANLCTIQDLSHRKKWLVAPNTWWPNIIWL